MLLQRCLGRVVIAVVRWLVIVLLVRIVVEYPALLGVNEQAVLVILVAPEASGRAFVGVGRPPISISVSVVDQGCHNFIAEFAAAFWKLGAPGKFQATVFKVILLSMGLSGLEGRELRYSRGCLE